MSPDASTFEVRLAGMGPVRQEFVKLGRLWRNTGDLDRDCLRWAYRSREDLALIDPYVFDFPVSGSTVDIHCTTLLRSPVRRFAEANGGSESWAYRVLCAVFLNHQMHELELVNAVSEETRLLIDKLGIWRGFA